MRFPKILSILLVIILLASTGCQKAPTTISQTTQTINPAGTAAPAVSDPQSPSTSMMCTENPDKLSVVVKLGKKSKGFQPVSVTGKGFTPGEKLSIIFEGQGKSHSSRLEAWDFPVKKDGSFVNKESLQLDEANMQWNLYIMHQRGIACSSFTTK
jgi:hypothetical protein